MEPPRKKVKLSKLFVLVEINSEQKVLLRTSGGEEFWLRRSALPAWLELPRGPASLETRPWDLLYLRDCKVTEQGCLIGTWLWKLSPDPEKHLYNAVMSAKDAENKNKSWKFSLKWGREGTLKRDIWAQKCAFSPMRFRIFLLQTFMPVDKKSRAPVGLEPRALVSAFLKHLRENETPAWSLMVLNRWFQTDNAHLGEIMLAIWGERWLLSLEPGDVDFLGHVVAQADMLIAVAPQDLVGESRFVQLQTRFRDWVYRDKPAGYLARVDRLSSTAARFLQRAWRRCIFCPGDIVRAKASYRQECSNKSRCASQISVKSLLFLYRWICLRFEIGGDLFVPHVRRKQSCKSNELKLIRDLVGNLTKEDQGCGMVGEFMFKPFLELIERWTFPGESYQPVVFVKINQPEPNYFWDNAPHGLGFSTLDVLVRFGLLCKFKRGEDEYSETWHWYRASQHRASSDIVSACRRFLRGGKPSEQCAQTQFVQTGHTADPEQAHALRMINGFRERASLVVLNGQGGSGKSAVAILNKLGLPMLCCAGTHKVIESLSQKLVLREEHLQSLPVLEAAFPTSHQEWANRVEQTYIFPRFVAQPPDFFYPPFRKTKSDRQTFDGLENTHKCMTATYQSILQRAMRHRRAPTVKALCEINAVLERVLIPELADLVFRYVGSWKTPALPTKISTHTCKVRAVDLRSDDDDSSSSDEGAGSSDEEEDSGDGDEAEDGAVDLTALRNGSPPPAAFEGEFVIMLDEASTIDLVTFSHILHAFMVLVPKARGLIIGGDSCQSPPFGGGVSVLDLLERVVGSGVTTPSLCRLRNNHRATAANKDLELALSIFRREFKTQRAARDALAPLAPWAKANVHTGFALGDCLRHIESSLSLAEPDFAPLLDAPEREFVPPAGQKTWLGISMTKRPLELGNLYFAHRLMRTNDSLRHFKHPPCMLGAKVLVHRPNFVLNRELTHFYSTAGDTRLSHRNAHMLASSGATGYIVAIQTIALMVEGENSLLEVGPPDLWARNGNSDPDAKAWELLAAGVTRVVLWCPNEPQEFIWTLSVRPREEMQFSWFVTVACGQGSQAQEVHVLLAEKLKCPLHINLAKLFYVALSRSVEKTCFYMPLLRDRPPIDPMDYLVFAATRRYNPRIC